MTSPSILSIICEAQKLRRLRKFEQENPLLDYLFGLDELRRLIHLSAEIRPESLDKVKCFIGFDPLDDARLAYRDYEGDVPAQFISSRLGGEGNSDINIFALNKDSDISGLKLDEDKVYDYVKQSSDRWARMMFALKYEDEMPCGKLRPFKIYYHFILFEGDKAVEEPIEGIFENPSPHVTQPCDRCSHLRKKNESEAKNDTLIF